MAAIVLFIGLVLELSCCNQAFARSGSVLVAFAITLVFANYHFDTELNHYKSVCADKFGYDYAKSILVKGESENWAVHQTDESGNQSFSFDNTPESRAHHKSIVEQYEYGFNMLPTFEFIRSKTMLAEYIFGSVGTLIWGFGDLVPKIT